MQMQMQMQRGPVMVMRAAQALWMDWQYLNKRVLRRHSMTVSTMAITA